MSDSFEFTADNLAQAKTIIGRYPEGFQASAVMPLLFMAQRQNANHLTVPAIEYVAEMLSMPVIRVMEVATFYTMYNLEPVGTHLIQVCGTTPCMLRGSDELISVCKNRIGKQHEISADGKFTWIEVECMGACANAPMIQLANPDGDHYVEDLDGAKLEALMDDLAAGKTIKYGPQSDRNASEPHGTKVLTDPSLYDGSRAKKIKLPNTGKAEG